MHTWDLEAKIQIKALKDATNCTCTISIMLEMLMVKLESMQSGI